MSHRRDHRDGEGTPRYRCEHAVILPEADDHSIVLAEHQAADPEDALRWVLERASCISVHLSEPAAETVEFLVSNEGQHASFLAALQAGHGYGFEISDPGTRKSLDKPTVHRFTTRRPRAVRPQHPE